jgi:hypothetical protein
MVDILAVRDDEGRMLNCDMLRRAVKQAVTRRFPNGVTPLLEIVVTP